MKKQTLLLLILVCGCALFGQDKEVYIQAFVKEDTVQLRWAPTTANLLIRGLNQGYLITKKNNSTGVKTEFTILPFADRKKDLLTSKDTVTAFTTGFIQEYLTNTATDEAQKQAPFFMFSLSASSSRAIATVLGLYFEDLGIGKTTYSYSIRFGDSDVLADEVTVDAEEKSRNPPCSELVATSRIDLKETYLKWETKSLVKSYGGYWLLKSEDGKKFNRINKTPLYYFTSQYEPDKMVIDFIDTAVTEGQTYYYQVEPINHFAEIGEPSNIAQVYIQKRLNGICNIDTVRSDELNRIIIGKYITDMASDEVSEFVLLRGDKIDSTFLIIDNQKAINGSFEFNYQTNLRSGDRHYFKVAAVSVDGDTAMSFPYYHFSLDQEPPAKPTDFKGEVDENGIATLTWRAPADKDIRGYRLFRSNSLREEFVEITNKLSPELTYQDTLPLDNLSSEVYYKIRTVDLNFNNSKSTNPILLMKPDTIAPVPSVIKKYLVKPEGIYLEWSNSRSTDLLSQCLVRKNGISVDTLVHFTTEFNTFQDTLLTIGKQYEYQIITFDQSKNLSKSESLTLTYETGYRAAPYNLQAVANRANKSIKLTWTHSSIDPIYSIQIYRAKNNGQFKLYKTIREDVNTFDDRDLSPNNSYKYKVKLVFTSGKSSKMSEGVGVVY